MPIPRELFMRFGTEVERAPDGGVEFELPQEVLDALRIGPGDRLDLRVEDGRLVMQAHSTDPALLMLLGPALAGMLRPAP
jgi:hypothetical protein